MQKLRLKFTMPDVPVTVYSAQYLQYMIMLPYLEQCGFTRIEPFNVKSFYFETEPHSVEEFYMIYPASAEKYCKFEFVPV